MLYTGTDLERVVAEAGEDGVHLPEVVERRQVPKVAALDYSQVTIHHSQA